MHSVVELSRFIKSAQAAGMSDVEREDLVAFLAKNPDAGDEIKGTGGCRKLRWAKQGMGKRGGVRVITFYSGETIPVFLLVAYAKNAKADLTPAEAKELGKFTKALVNTYGKKVTPLRSA